MEHIKAMIGFRLSFVSEIYLIPKESCLSKTSEELDIEIHVIG